MLAISARNSIYYSDRYRGIHWVRNHGLMSSGGNFYREPFPSRKYLVCFYQQGYFSNVLSNKQGILIFGMASSKKNKWNKWFWTFQHTMQNFIETKFGSKQVLHEDAWKCDWYIFFTTSTDLKLFLLHFCNKWPIWD